MRHLLGFLVLGLSLSSCSWMGLDSDWLGWDSEPPASLNNQAQNYACPALNLVPELSIYQHPSSANEDNLVINARMGKTRSHCGGTADELQIEGSFDVVVMKGAYSASTLADIPFFVAAVDSQNNVLRKDLYEIPVQFENGQNFQRLTIPVKIAAPLSSGQPRILTGFNLSQEQLNANTAFLGEQTIPLNTPSP